MNTRDNQAIIKKMRVAYEEFAKQMTILKKQGDKFLKKSLKKVEMEKIEQALDEIKQIS